MKTKIALAAPLLAAGLLGSALVVPTVATALSVGPTSTAVDATWLRADSSFK